jgi:uncharacterized RDD family membrane protein YckC
MTPPTYAGFGTRFVACIIDFLILLIPAGIFGVVTSGLGGMLVYFAYKIIFEASAVQGTPGKRAMGIMVTDMNGQKLDLKTASIRAVVAFLSGSLTACLGHIVALFTDKKQAAHDLMAETVVVTGETKAPLIESWLDTARELFAKSKSV